jgi:hypothetical protein
VFLVSFKFTSLFIFLFTFSDYFCTQSQGVLLEIKAEIIPKEPGRVMSLREKM